jgi:hypothetical protein
VEPLYLFPLIFYLGGAFAIASFAESKGRPYFGWFVLSLLLTPLVTFFLVAIGLDYRTPEQKAFRCKLCGRRSPDKSTALSHAVTRHQLRGDVMDDSIESTA